MKFEGVIVLYILLALILILFGGLSLVYSKSVEQNFVFDSTYTRALCSGRTCRDFEIKCLGDEVLEMKPISGFVTFSNEWVDLREDEELC